MCLCLKGFGRNYLQETMAKMKLSTHVSEPLIHMLSHSHSREVAPQFRRLETSAVDLDLCHRKSFHLKKAAVIWPQIHLRHIVQQSRGKTLLCELMMTALFFLKICLT